jgi:hypothetical protein
LGEPLRRSGEPVKNRQGGAVTEDQEMSAALRRCAGHVAALSAASYERERRLDRVIEILSQLFADDLVNSAADGALDLVARTSRAFE